MRLISSRVCLLIHLALLPAPVGAIEAKSPRHQTNCTRGGMLRTIEIIENDDRDEMACKVIITKADEGFTKPKTLWQAQHETGFCKIKLKELTAAHQGWGFRCEVVR